MSAPSIYEAHYITDGYNENPTPDNPLIVLCMDDGPAEDMNIGPAHFQTAGSLYGYGHDDAFAQAAHDKHMLLDVPLVTIRAARVLGPTAMARLHEGGCAGEKTAPYTPQLVASANPPELFAGIQALGLNLGDTPIEQAIEVNKRYALTRPSPLPSAERAAEIVENHPDSRLQRIPLVREEHRAPVILSNLSTTDIFDTRGAWEAGHPAYNISFGGLAGFASRARGEVLSQAEEELLLAVSGIRHLVAAQVALSHPVRGKELQIFTHQ